MLFMILATVTIAVGGVFAVVRRKRKTNPGLSH
jgi:hypothetical protein